MSRGCWIKKPSFFLHYIDPHRCPSYPQPVLRPHSSSSRVGLTFQPWLIQAGRSPASFRRLPPWSVGLEIPGLEMMTKQNALRFNERESDKAWAKRYYRILNTAAAQGSDIMRNPPSLLNQDPHVFGTDYLASVKPQCADSYPGFISCWDILWSSVSTSGPNTWTLTFLQHLA